MGDGTVERVMASRNGGRLWQAVLTLAAAPPAWGAGGSFACACTANVPEVGIAILEMRSILALKGEKRETKR